ncbi:MAG: tetratricopeptide repeat protein, partial [Planctomycetes bacterium]|nr:tetratricopeptide repeat protein [Planctomycetota bacterium]
PRAGLHLLALELIEAIHPDPDSAAAEMADHARIARAVAPHMTVRERELRLRAMARARAAFAPVEAARQAELLVELNEGSPPADLARALRDLADTARTAGRRQLAESAARRALDLAGQSGDAPLVTTCMVSLGVVLHETARPAEAEPLLTEACRRLDAHNLPGTLAAVLVRLGQLFRATGRPEDSGRAMQRALEIARAAKDREREGEALNGLAALAHMRGDQDAALDLARRSLELAEASGNVRSQGIMLGNIGLVLMERGQWQEAEASIRQGAAVSARAGNLSQQGICMVDLGLLCSRLGRVQEGEQFLQEAIGLLGEVGNLRAAAQAWLNLATLRYNQGRPQPALEACTIALDLAHQARDPVMHARVRSEQALTLRSLGRFAEALAGCDAAIEAARAAGARADLNKFLMYRAELRLLTGDTTGCEADLTAAGHGDSSPLPARVALALPLRIRLHLARDQHREAATVLAEMRRIVTEQKFPQTSDEMKLLSRCEAAVAGVTFRGFLAHDLSGPERRALLAAMNPADRQTVLEHIPAMCEE